jgi:hypothetical protein
MPVDEHGLMPQKQGIKITLIKLRFALQTGHDNFPIINKTPAQNPGRDERLKYYLKTHAHDAAILAHQG